jgi:hypothetical protein
MRKKTLVQCFRITDKTGERMGQRLDAKVTWWLLLLAICTHFCLAYVQNCQPFLDLNRYIQGSARLPYQYRVLMAWVLREGLRIPYIAAISSHLPPPIRDPRFLILFASSWLSLFGSVMLTWGSLSCLTGDSDYSRWASLLVIYMAYFHFPLVFGLNFLLPYDLPSLFFFCGCLYCIISGRMLFFYLFFILGTFNRETICMATLFLVIWRWRESKRRMQTGLLLGHILMQVVTWIAIKLYLRHSFAHNVADVANATPYYKLAGNLKIILEAKQWPVLLSVFGFTLPLVLTWRKSMKNAAMEREIYFLAAWFVVMMLVGVIIEIRVFSELISYMALAVALIGFHRIFSPQRTIPTQGQSA